MIMAGTLERQIGEPQPSMQISKMQTTPTAESTRIPLRTSIEKREKPLTSEQLLDFEQSAQYMSCHQDGARSQGDTRHSMPPARRQGGFNLEV